MNDLRASLAEDGTSLGASFVRSVSWNYLGYLCEFIAGVLLLAYVVRRVPVEDYGIYLLAQSIAGFLYILDFGLSNVLVQLYVATWTSQGIAQVCRLASTLFWALMGTGTLGALVLSALAWLVPQMIKLPAQRTETTLALVILAAATVALTMPAMALEHLCQAFDRFDRINQVQIGMVVLRVGLTVAVLSAGKGIIALASVQALVSMVRLLALWTVAQAGIAGVSLRLFCFDTFRVRQAIGMSGWALGDDLSRRLAMSADTMIVAGLGSFRQVAMLGMGAKLPAHLFQFAARGLSVMMPSLSRHHSEGDTAQLRRAYGNDLHSLRCWNFPPIWCSIRTTGFAGQRDSAQWNRWRRLRWRWRWLFRLAQLESRPGWRSRTGA